MVAFKTALLTFVILFSSLSFAGRNNVRGGADFHRVPSGKIPAIDALMKDTNFRNMQMALRVGADDNGIYLPKRFVDSASGELKFDAAKFEQDLLANRTNDTDAANALKVLNAITNPSAKLAKQLELALKLDPTGQKYGAAEIRNTSKVGFAGTFGEDAYVALRDSAEEEGQIIKSLWDLVDSSKTAETPERWTMAATLVHVYTARIGEINAREANSAQAKAQKATEIIDLKRDLMALVKDADDFLGVNEKATGASGVASISSLSAALKQHGGSAQFASGNRRRLVKAYTSQDPTAASRLSEVEKAQMHQLAIGLFSKAMEDGRISADEQDMLASFRKLGLGDISRPTDEQRELHEVTVRALQNFVAFQKEAADRLGTTDPKKIHEEFLAILKRKAGVDFAPICKSIKAAAKSGKKLDDTCSLLTGFCLAG